MVEVVEEEAAADASLAAPRFGWPSAVRGIDAEPFVCRNATGDFCCSHPDMDPDKE